LGFRLPTRVRKSINLGVELSGLPALVARVTQLPRALVPSCPRSQAPAWECYLGSSSFPNTREAGASAKRFPSGSLGTRSKQELGNQTEGSEGGAIALVSLRPCAPSCPRSQAPAWECYLGSSRFPNIREAGASAKRFPSGSLGTRSNGDQRTRI
jgi:hypothetical protein